MSWGRSRALIVLLGAVILAGLAREPALSDGGPTCNRRGYVTVLKTPSVQVVRTRRVKRDGATSWKYYGCLTRTGKPVLIGNGYDESEDFYADLRHFKAAAPYVGFVSIGGPEGAGICSTSRPVAMNLETGVKRFPSGEDWSGCHGVYSYVLRNTGALAWIFDDLRPGPWVVAYDKRGFRRLDGPSGKVDKDSLRLNGKRAVWREAGRVRSARLY